MARTPSPPAAASSYREARRVVLLLTASTTLVMTGIGIIFPVFGKRVGELGGGVGDLALMMVAFSGMQLVLAPVAGAVSDRVGRRPVILFALLGFALTNLLYLVANSTATFMLVRALEGAVTVGLFPAGMALNADLMPPEQRARWMGIMQGGSSVGFIIGPVFGGVLFDVSGFAAPFVVSAALGFIAFVAAFVLVPESRRQQTDDERASDGRAPGWRSWLPQARVVFGVVLFIAFMNVFAFAFVEPALVFHFYDDLGFSPTQFGAMVMAWGTAMALGQLFASGLSDRVGRRLPIFAGMLLQAVFFGGLASAGFGYVFIVAGALIAGIGSALANPAITAQLMDISEEGYRGRMMGAYASTGSLGGVTGPLLVGVVAGALGNQGVFATAALLLIATALTASLLSGPRR